MREWRETQGREEREKDYMEGEKRERVGWMIVAGPILGRGR